MKKGFTLIELLVVVLIIGILSAVALPQYTKAVEKAKVTEVMTVGKSIADAQNIYFMENGEYALNPEDLILEIPELKHYTLGHEDGHIFTQRSHALQEIGSTFYTFSRNGSEYDEIKFYLENGKLKEINCRGWDKWCHGLLPCGTSNFDIGTDGTISSSGGCTF